MKIIKNSLNFLLPNFAIFIVMSIWTGFYIKSRTLSLLFSLILTIMVFLLLKFFFSKRQNTKQQTIIHKKNLENFKLFLTCLTPDEFYSFMLATFKEKISTEKEEIIFNGNTLVLNARCEKLTKEKLISFCKKAKKLEKNKIAIICTQENENSVLFANSISNFEIEFVNLEELFLAAEKNKISYDNIIKIKNKTSLTIKQILTLIFARKNAKKFFFFGILSYITSFLTFFKLYYYIFASIFLVFGVICLLRPKEKSQKSLIF